jgi:hypothetical protein
MPIDQGDVRVGLVQQRVGKSQAHGAAADDQVVRLDVLHGVTLGEDGLAPRKQGLRPAMPCRRSIAVAALPVQQAGVPAAAEFGLD